MVKRRNKAGRALDTSDWTVVFDCETTTDPGQALRLGFCRVYFREELRHEICFYKPGMLYQRDAASIRRWASRANVALMSCDEFIDKILYKYGYELRGTIVGFNLPFDLSRLAISHFPARTTQRDKSMYGGFSLKLSPFPWCPPVQIKHLSRFVSFMRYAGYSSPANRSQRKRGQSVPVKRGYFVDVRTLAAALLSKSFTLGSLAKFLSVEARKLETDEHGRKLTAEYLDYARRDVLTTWHCYQALRSRYAAMSLETPISRVFSEASLGKAYFNKMGIQPWLSLQPNVPRSLLADIMSTFYGGRSEVRIRREMRQVVLCDFLSMYPTVCTLMGLWRYVIARGIDWKDGTREIKRLLDSWTLADLQKPENWSRLVALVQVIPEGDVFPVRAAYDSNADGTIGANYLSSKSPMWFTLADCLAAQLLTGKRVKVLKAVIFKPRAPQVELRQLTFADGQTVDPYRDDLYKSLIETRQKLKDQRNNASGDELAQLDIAQNTIKIAANATSYGIFAEINVTDSPLAQRLKIFGSCDNPFSHMSNKEEQPGRFFHPLVATTITGAARLMLAMAERLVTDAGLEWTFCDTDSMAIARPANMSECIFNEKVDEVVGWFRRLNPYKFGGDILKIEDVNYGLKNRALREPLFVWAVSAKRYVLFNIEKIRPIIRKASAHGLGYLRAPYGEQDAPKEIPPPKIPLPKIGVQRWQHDLWWTIANAAIQGKPDYETTLDFHPTFRQPAMSQYAATTPKNLRWFDAYNKYRTYADQVKPFGFVCVFYGNELAEVPSATSKTSLPKPVAPFDKDPGRAAKSAFDRITGEQLSPRGLKTYAQVLAQYHLHPESKFLNGDFLDRGTTFRRHVYANEIQYIGKESNKWEEHYFLGFDPDDELRYGAKPQSKRSLAKVLARYCTANGTRTTAAKLGISRTKLSKLLENGFSGCAPEFVQRISGIIVQLDSEKSQQKQEIRRLKGLALSEMRRLGASKFAGILGIDVANLSKMVSGSRNLCKRLAATLLKLA
jgi:hypothetical protein